MNLDLLKTWLQDQKERCDKATNNAESDFGANLYFGRADAYNNVLLFIEELESIGDPEEEEKFEAKLFPSNPLNPIEDENNRISYPNNSESRKKALSNLSKGLDVKFKNMGENY